jgi:hypothetical protein
VVAVSTKAIREALAMLKKEAPASSMCVHELAEAELEALERAAATTLLCADGRPVSDAAWTEARGVLERAAEGKV